MNHYSELQLKVDAHVGAHRRNGVGLEGWRSSRRTAVSPCRLDHLQVDFALHDGPVAWLAYPFTWSAVIPDGPKMPVGTEGELHIDGGNTARGHPFVVITSARHVSELQGRENA